MSNGKSTAGTGLGWEYIADLPSLGRGSVELHQPHLSWADGSGLIPPT